MSERKWKRRRKARRDLLRSGGTILTAEECAAEAERAHAASESMARAQRRNVERVRAEYPDKVADKALAMGRAERRRYLKDMRRKARKEGAR